jgi:hypothetical protein
VEYEVIDRLLWEIITSLMLMALFDSVHGFTIVTCISTLLWNYWRIDGGKQYTIHRRLQSPHIHIIIGSERIPVITRRDYKPLSFGLYLLPLVIAHGDDDGWIGRGD